jgi:predicted secreted protein
MSLIVAGRFTTFPAAEDAAQTLFDNGFPGEDVTLFFVNPRGQHARHPLDEHAAAPPTISSAPPPTHPRHHRAVTIGAVAGAVIGVAVFTAFSASMPVVVIAAGVGAYLGLVVGKMVQARSGPHEHHDVVHHEMRNSGVLVAVHVSPENQINAARILREAGGADIERATGHWQRGKWADFDPRQTPVPLTELNQQQA